MIPELVKKERKMDAKKLEELFEDSSAVEEVFSGDKDQVLAKLAARGIEMTEAELAEFSFGITNGAKGSDDELSMDELESVAGGAKKKKAKVKKIRKMEKIKLIKIKKGIKVKKKMKKIKRIKKTMKKMTKIRKIKIKRKRMEKILH